MSSGRRLTFVNQVDRPISIKSILLALFILFAFPVQASAPREDWMPKDISQGNTLRPTNPISTPTSRVLTKEDFRGLKYESLISCLAWYESSWRVDVYGDGGLAYGPLQYHLATFEEYCEGDYNSPEDQLKCADKMISNQWSSVYLWSVAERCIR